MFTTNNDHGRETLIRLLNARLADAIDLLYQAKQAHWNVTGREFYALHQLFEQISEELREHVDDIAERAAQLGGEAEGTIKMAAEHSSLPEYPRHVSGGAAHLEALSGALDAAGTSMRDAIDQAASLGDEVTVDIFVGATRAIDKLHWMVRAHSKGQPAQEAGHAAREPKSERTTRPRH
jgi:starvation-inducible DNA-binding protein